MNCFSIYLLRLLICCCRYFDPQPSFFYFDDLGGTVCHISFPSNSPIHQIVSAPQLSMENAKKDACLKAIEQLHKLGALNDFLLPEQEAADEELVGVSSDPDSYEGRNLATHYYNFFPHFQLAVFLA